MTRYSNSERVIEGRISITKHAKHYVKKRAHTRNGAVFFSQPKRNARKLGRNMKDVQYHFDSLVHTLALLDGNTFITTAHRG